MATRNPVAGGTLGQSAGLNPKSGQFVGVERSLTFEYRVVFMATLFEGRRSRGVP